MRVSVMDENDRQLFAIGKLAKLCTNTVHSKYGAESYNFI
jgi:hypothetical protein